MRFTIAALAAFIAVAFAIPAARADFPRLGIFRKKTKDKEEPPQRVKQLVDVLKSDPDEKKRKAAAEELRQHDPRTNTDLIPTLINSLQADPSAAVRAEAAESIGKLKPVAQQAGVALEQTQSADPSEDVRKAAQKALWDYHLNGYRSAGANPAYPQTTEPPLAKPRTAAKIPITPPPPRTITSGIGKGAIYPQTVEPPLAKSRPRPVEPPTPSLSVPPLPEKETNPPPATPAVPVAKPGVPVITPPPQPEPKTAAPSVPAPMPPVGAGVPASSIPTIPSPAAPTVPAGPAVPTIPPPK